MITYTMDIRSATVSIVATSTTHTHLRGGTSIMFEYGAEGSRFQSVLQKTENCNLRVHEKQCKIDAYLVLLSFMFFCNSLTECFAHSFFFFLGWDRIYQQGIECFVSAGARQIFRLCIFG